VVAHIDPPITAKRGTPAHILGVVYMSDYHVMDCPLNIHGVPIGLFPIGDQSKTPLPATMKIMTSLNHTIHFHAHDGFRADELMYVEATSPWAKDGRALINTRIFSRQGMLIATVVQEVSLQSRGPSKELDELTVPFRRFMSSRRVRNCDNGVALQCGIVVPSFLPPRACGRATSTRRTWTAGGTLGTYILASALWRWTAISDMSLLAVFRQSREVVLDRTYHDR
jgi:hypothetical protein